MRVLLITLLLIAAIPAYGSMIVVTGVTELSPPPSSLLPGALTSDSTIYGFAEQQGVLLTSPLDAGITSPGNFTCCSPLSPGTIPAGATVNSYLLYASPSSDEPGFDFRQFDGEVSFSPGETIVGIIVGYQNIVGTDTLLGAPGTVYPPSTYKLGGLEPGHDQVILSSNMESVYVNFFVQTDGEDVIRILTTTPEPADFLLIGSGLVVLGLFRRRLQRFLAGRQN
jgi:hypothetical protein